MMERLSLLLLFFVGRAASFTPSCLHHYVRHTTPLSVSSDDAPSSIPSTPNPPAIEDDDMLDLIQKHHRDHFSLFAASALAGKVKDGIRDVLYDERDYSDYIGRNVNEKDDLTRFAKKLNSVIRRGGVREEPFADMFCVGTNEVEDELYKYCSFTTTISGGRALGILLRGESASNVESLLALCEMARRLGEKTVTSRDVNNRLNVPFPSNEYFETWNKERERKMELARRLLERMKRKQSVRGAFDTLCSLKVFGKHENLNLLRSNFPTHFTPTEERIALSAIDNKRDIDSILGIRRDFRRFKIYTIDAPSTREVDDGISIEVVPQEDGSIKQRFWVHISDVDRWAPRDSKLIEVARKRGTTLYTPQRTYNMFPQSIVSEKMSLFTTRDCCALSVGMFVKEDGVIDRDSIVVTPSLVRVTYRLSYAEVDEMLEEGVGWEEEWQIGALYNVAAKRRKYRERNNAVEKVMPTTIPSSSVSVRRDRLAEDMCSIYLTVESSHNSGVNETAMAENGPIGMNNYVSGNGNANANTNANGKFPASFPSPSNLLVTEIMIMASEAVGMWGESKQIQLPYRTQRAPNFRERMAEYQEFNRLLSENVGMGWCSAWYGRRFFNPAITSDTPDGHAGLGLQHYVQFTSPIRRFQDLNVHAAIKRQIRLEKVQQMCKTGETLSEEVKSVDLGVHISGVGDCIFGDPYPVEYKEGNGLVREGRNVMKACRQVRGKEAEKQSGGKRII